MSGRADRWWRPAGQRRNARPAVQSARRGRYAAEQQYMDGFELGLDVGAAEERSRNQRRDEQMRRVADAAEAAQRGDSSELMALAEAAGVTPLADVDGGELVDELEAWLHEQRGGE